MRANSITILFVATSLAAASSFAVHAQPVSSADLVGTWSWTVPSGQCTETHTYRADGTRYVVSGQERSDSTFKTERAPSGTFMKLTITTTKDYGGKDCGESDEDDTGKTSSVYFVLSPDRQKVLFCFEPSFKDCYGPFQRKPGV
jgi:hypothetical protein